MQIGSSMRDRQLGFTYLGILVFVALVGIGLAAVGEVWDTAVRREKERDLLLAGHALRLAIGRYHAAGPNSASRYPPSLEALLKDNRVPGIRRYLRQIPVDPVTGKPDWATIAAPGGGISGVHSRSEMEPLKVANFDKREDGFEGTKKYMDWKFVFVPEQRPPPSMRVTQ